MKNTIIDILWYLLNKLDPLSVGLVNISTDKITLELKKKYFRKNHWEMFTFGVNGWILFGKGVKHLSEVSVHINNSLTEKYRIESYSSLPGLDFKEVTN